MPAPGEHELGVAHDVDAGAAGVAHGRTQVAREPCRMDWAALDGTSTPRDAALFESRCGVRKKLAELVVFGHAPSEPMPRYAKKRPGYSLPSPDSSVPRTPPDHQMAQPLPWRCRPKRMPPSAMTDLVVHGRRHIRHRGIRGTPTPATMRVVQIEPTNAHPDAVDAGFTIARRSAVATLPPMTCRSPHFA